MRFVIETFQGQKLLTDQAQRVSYFHIAEPFRVASQVLGWHTNSMGIGINQAILSFVAARENKLRIFVGSQDTKCYEVDPSLWLDWAFANHSTFRVLGSKYKVELVELPFDEHFFATITKQDDSSIVEAWIRLKHFLITGKAITAPIEVEA